MNFDWTRLTDDPNDPRAKAEVRALLPRLRRVHTDTDLTGFVARLAAGRRVLDVGVAAHSMRHLESPDWRHGKIAKAAARCVGVDILESLVDLIRQRGYDVRLVDATSDVDLGERFDVIFIGDVIEHVDNPGALLRFAKRHLAPGGRILAATPNPFSRKFHRQFVKRRDLVVNLDHVAWFTPSMAMELARRTGLSLSAYHLVKPIAGASRVWKALVWRWGLASVEYSFPDYLFEFAGAEE